MLGILFIYKKNYFCEPIHGNISLWTKIFSTLGLSTFASLFISSQLMFKDQLFGEVLLNALLSTFHATHCTELFELFHFPLTNFIPFS